MVSFDEIQAAYYMVAATGVLIAAVFYILNLRISQRNQELMLKAQQQTLETRQAQMFMNIYQTDYSDEFIEALHLVMKMELRNADDLKKIRGDPNINKAWMKVASYFEGIGVLVRENLVDVRLVTMLSSGFIGWYWEHFGPGILRCREELNYPRYLIEVEYLADSVKKYGMEHPELKVVSPDFAAGTIT